MTTPLDTGMSSTPFPGLRPFRRDEADVFFGREEQVDQLLGKLETCRFLAVVGVSGCGKSSLVRAGMLSALEGGFLASAGPRWHVVEMRPGNHPLSNLAHSLLGSQLLSEEWTNHDDAQAYVRAVLKRGPLGLVELLRESLHPGKSNLLLLVDQFEEIFRFHRHGDANEATAFVDLLLASANQAETPIYVVLTMRSDFLGDCTVFSGVPEAINEGQFLIPRLSREQCKAAILGPPAMFDADVEPELVNHVLNDIGSDPDQLPLMQHALMRVWNRAGEETISEPHNGKEENGFITLTLSEYQAVGGLKNALSNHADELFNGFSAEDQRVAETMFRALSERGADGRDIRRPVPLQTVADVAQVSPDVIARIVEVFRDPTCSFLTPPAGVELEPDTVLDISHESLIRQWKRMTEWVQTEADSAAIYRRLSETARLWKADRAALWVTPDLENALAWRDREKPSTAWAERYGGRFEESMAFLDASVEAHDAAQREEEQRLARERELLESQARAEKQRADEQAAANRQIKKRAVIALAAGVVSIALAIAAVVLFLQARNDRDRANTASAKAAASAEKEHEFRTQAEQLAQKAMASRLQVLSQSLTMHHQLGAWNLARVEALWNAETMNRQDQAFQLLKDTAKLHEESQQIFAEVGQETGEVKAQNQMAWQELAPQLRKQAVRWLMDTSLYPVNSLELQARRSSRSYQEIHIGYHPDGQSAVIYQHNEDNKGGVFKIWEFATGNILASQIVQFEDPKYAQALYVKQNTVYLAVKKSYSSSGWYIVQYDLKNLGRKSPKPVFLDLKGISGYSSNNEAWFEQRGNQVLFVRNDYNNAAVWDAATGKRLFHAARAKAVRGITRQGEILIIRDNKVDWIDLKDKIVNASFPLVSPNSGKNAFASPNGKWLAVLAGNAIGSSSGSYAMPVEFYDLDKGKLVSETRLDLGTTYSSSYDGKLAFHPTLPIVSAVMGQYVHLVSIKDGGILTTKRTQDSLTGKSRAWKPLCAEYHPSGKLLLTAVEQDGNSSNSSTQPMSLKLWDAPVAKTSVTTFSVAGGVKDLQLPGEESVAMAVLERNRSGSTKHQVQVRSLGDNQDWSAAGSRLQGGFEPSGKHYVQILDDRAVILDTVTGKQHAVIYGLGDTPPRYVTSRENKFQAQVNSYRWLVGRKDAESNDAIYLYDATNLEWAAKLPSTRSVSTYPNIQFSDDGEYVGIGIYGENRDYRTSIWSTAEKREVLNAPNNSSDWIITPSGYFFCRVNTDNSYRTQVYSLQTGKRVMEQNWGSNSSSSGSLRYRFWLTPNAKTAVFAAQEGNNHVLYVWHFAQGKPPARLPVVLNYPEENHINLTNTRLAYSGSAMDANKKFTSGFRIWDLETLKLVRSLPNINSAYYVNRFSPERGAAFVRFNNSNSCKLIDLTYGTIVAEFSELPRAICPKGHLVLFSSGQITGLSDKRFGFRLGGPAVAQKPPEQIKIWSPKINRHKFSSDGQFLVRAQRVGNDYRKQHLIIRKFYTPDYSDWTIEDYDGGGDFQITADNKTLAVVHSEKREVQMWDLETQQLSHTISLEYGNTRPGDSITPNSLAVSYDGSSIALIDASQLRIGSQKAGRIHTGVARDGHTSPVHQMAVSPDRKILATTSADQTVCFWNTDDGRYRGMLDVGTPSLNRVVFSPKGNYLATRNSTGEVTVWQWEPPSDKSSRIKAKHLWSSARMPGGVLAFDLTGTQLIVTGTGGRVKFYETKTGTLLNMLLPITQTGAVEDLKFHPEGKLLAFARSNKIALWNLETRALERVWDAGQETVTNLAFPKDGRLLVSTGKDVRIWNTVTGELELTIDRDASRVSYLALSESGNRLAFATNDQTVVLANMTELLASVEELGLNWSTKETTKSQPTQDERLAFWKPASDQEVQNENTLVKYTPLAGQAEKEENWQAAVEALTKLIEVQPNNMAFRNRRSQANLERKNYALAAVDISKKLDKMNQDRARHSGKSRYLYSLIQRKDPLYHELQKLRPDDTLLWIALGRDLILRSEWKPAQQAFGAVIKKSPPNEEWYEYAMLCLLAEDQAAYKAHAQWMLDNKDQADTDYMSYVQCRATALSPVPPVPVKTMLAWADHSLSKDRKGWYLHAASLAEYRAGHIEEARTMFQESLDSTWGTKVLNHLLVALIESQEGNHEVAQQSWQKMQAWINRIESEKNEEGYVVDILYPDWLEYNVLVKEVESVLPAVAAKPGDPPVVIEAAEKPIPQKPEKPDAERILGRWTVQSMQRGGKEREMGNGSATLEFTTDTAVMYEGNRKPSPAGYQIDPKKNPKWITISPPGEKESMQGIYKFEGETLTICFQSSPGGRPEKFETETGNFTSLMVLKRKP